MPHSQLFQPIELPGFTARNRLWVPPMCQYSVKAHDGVATPWHLMHYGALAAGGAGAIIIEATGVLPEGRITNRCLGLWNDAQEEALAKIVSLVHGEGAAVGIQLNHAGRKGSIYPEWDAPASGSIPLDEGGWPTPAPSPIAFPGYREPYALTTEEIAEITQAFARSAERAVCAGVDFVEIHAAHGYLLHQFLSPLSNHREDEYGGSLEGRARFLLEVIKVVRAKTTGKSLLVRISATDWLEGGLTLEESCELSVMMARAGVDFIDVSTGANLPAPIDLKPGYQIPHAHAIKQASGLPVAGVGLMNTAETAEAIVAGGLTDVVLVGRAALRDPFFAIHAAIDLGVPAPIPPQAARAFR